MGISDQIRAGSPELLANPTGKRWYEMSKTSPQEGVKAAIEAVVSMQTGKPVFDASKLTASAWAHATAAAEKWNQPGVFTTLHGFEWTSAPGGNNLHRTVVFRDNADRVNQVVPFSTFDSQDPADLWKYMDAYAKKTGGQVLAIPHNGNLSNGMMYSAETFDGKPMDRAYAEARASHEPLLEATQIKGDSETHPYLSPNDEFANFERWDINFGKMEPAQNSVLRAATTSARRSSWVWNWKPSLEPTPTSRPDRRQRCPHRRGHHSGKTTSSVSLPTDCRRRTVGRPRSPWSTTIRRKGRWSRSGANKPRAWAACGRARTPARRSGTRSSARKSTPPRATGRSCACSRAGTSRQRTSSDPTSRRTATPMACPWAAISVKAPAGKRPVFMVHALRDPDGPNLDRIQIIKGWLGKDGKTQERIFDVAVSGGRKIGPDGRCKTPVGSTVDVRERDLHQHHRRRDAVGVLEGPGVRCDAARVLLRARDPDPVAALDGL